MDASAYGIGDFVDEELGHRSTSHRTQVAKFLKTVGLTGDEHSTALIILRKMISLRENADIVIDEIQGTLDQSKKYDFYAATTEFKADVSCAEISLVPVDSGASLKTTNSLLCALFIEAHSNLIAWWLVTSWRGQQLAAATWSLGDSMQIAPRCSLWPRVTGNGGHVLG